MSRRLDIENVDAALSRAAYKAIHGTREDRAGQYQRVEPTMIASVRYDAEPGELRVTFRNGKTYLYHRVPLQIYLALIDAEAKETFLNEQIRDRFSFQTL